MVTLAGAESGHVPIGEDDNEEQDPDQDAGKD
jgi:hypothetical protein